MSKDFINNLTEEISKHTPWKWEGSVWENESQYTNWLRSQFRSIWSDYPIKNHYQMQRKIDVPKLDDDGNPTYYKTGKRKGHQVTIKAYICEQTGRMLRASKPKGQRYAEYNIDHIAPAGSCTTVEEALVYFLRLLTSPDNLQLIATDFHKIISHYDKYKDKYHFNSFNDASAHKQMIAICKDVRSVKSYLKKNGLPEGNNMEARKSVVFEFLRGNKELLLIRKDGYLER